MKKIILSICILASFIGQAYADTYLHGSIGEGEFSTGGSPDIYDLGIGFVLGPTLNFEIAYVDLGETLYVIDSISHLDEAADGFNFSLVADIPLNPHLDLYFAAGYMRWDDTSLYYEYDEYVDSLTVRGKDWNFGLGIKAEILESVDLKIGYTEYQLDTIDVESMTAGLIFRF